MAYDEAIVTRNFIGDYLSPASGTAAYTLMGLGVIQIDENLNPVLDQTPFVNNSSSSGTVTGYAPEYPLDVQLRTGETATMLLHDIKHNRKTGADAELYLVRVDLFVTPTTGAYPARRFKVCAKIDSEAAAGLEIVRLTGSLIQIGDHTNGTFNPTTLAFTES